MIEEQRTSEDYTLIEIARGAAPQGQSDRAGGRRVPCEGGWFASGQFVATLGVVELVGARALSDNSRHKRRDGVKNGELHDGRGSIKSEKGERRGAEMNAKKSRYTEAARDGIFEIA